MTTIVSNRTPNRLWTKRRITAVFASILVLGIIAADCDNEKKGPSHWWNMENNRPATQSVTR